MIFYIITMMFNDERHIVAFSDSDLGPLLTNSLLVNCFGPIEHSQQNVLNMYEKGGKRIEPHMDVYWYMADKR
jgi:hypothetical protein